MEKIDVVDGNDNVVGESTREEAHAKGLLHRIVHVIIRNSKGEILLQKRSKNDGIGNWDASVGGHVDTGESYEQAAKREMMEEVGISVPIKFVFKFREPTRFHLVACYAAKYDGPFKFNDESSEQKFFGKDEIRRIIRDGNIMPDAVISLKKILKLGERLN